MQGKKIFTGVLKFIKVMLILLVLFILFVIVVQRLSDNKANIMGIGVYTIISESMAPDYEVGDMLLTYHVKEEDLKVGDDVVYLGKVNDFKDKIVTHRIIKIDSRIHTKGTNNPVADPSIDYSQIYGKVIFKLSVLSTFSKLMNNNVLFYFIVFVPFTILIFFDLLSIVKDVKKAAAMEDVRIDFVNDFSDDLDDSDEE